MKFSSLGTSLPLGATLGDGGANSSLYSRSVLRVALRLFDRVGDGVPSRNTELDLTGKPAL